VIGYGASIGRGTRAAEAALWVCAGVVMLSAHVGGTAWMMREAPVLAAEDAPPAAIMIELAPEPEAVFTEANEIAPDLETAETSMPTEEALAPEEPAPTDITDEIEPEPVEEAEETVPDEPVEEVSEPIEEASVVLPDAVEVPLPAVRPKPPKVQQAEKEAPPRQFRPQAASVPKMRAKAQVTQSDRNAGRQSASGISSVAPARWQARLMAHLERRKRYPAGARARREQGIVHVRIRIDGSGNVLAVSLARSSGFRELDDEVLALVHRASPFPAPPPGAAMDITAPVRFSVR
jgi:periplasmic protein TonB